jgi:hypothetical protein
MSLALTHLSFNTLLGPADVTGTHSAVIEHTPRSDCCHWHSLTCHSTHSSVRLMSLALTQLSLNTGIGPTAVTGTHSPVIQHTPRSG